MDPSRTMARRAATTGTVLAAVGLPLTFQRTLVTRSDLDQALVTGLTFALQRAIVVTVQDSLQSGALLVARRRRLEAEVDPRTWSRTSIAVGAVAAVAGIGLQAALRPRPDEHLGRATLRTAGWVTSVTGAAGSVVGATQEAVGAESGSAAAAAATLGVGALIGQREWYRRRSETVLETQGLLLSEISPMKSLAMGAGVAVGTSLIGRFEGAITGRVARGLARALPGGEALWRPAGHLVSTGILVLGLRAAAQRVFRMIEGQQFAVEPALDVAPLDPEVSGAPESLVEYRTLAKMGRRFVWTLRRPDVIEQVMGRPAAARPIRVYVGLESAPTEEERVRLAIDELERAGGFERSWLMLTTPTGTGYANYAAAGALEFLTLGDCANVVMQYAARPSPISLDRVAEGRTQVRLLVDAVRERLESLPPDQRPRVVLFGESLGAWSSQDAFIDQGTRGLVDAGIDRAIWIGTPHESKWKDQVLKEERADVDRSLVGVFNDIGEWHRLDPAARGRIRYVMITHYNDGVALFGPELLVQAPEWLGEPAMRPPSVPRSQRWIPITTFVQTLIDTKNAARVVPGLFEADGHDYRADLVPFLDAVLGLEASEPQHAATTAALEQEESRRTRWIQERGKVGDSMAVALVQQLRSDDPEAFRRVAAEVGRQFTAGDRPAD
jgi:uncharacterized membrane protein